MNQTAESIDNTLLGSGVGSRRGSVIILERRPDAHSEGREVVSHALDDV